jgi:hypothetical protein
VGLITPTEWLVLGLRLLFVVLLYGAVAAAFLALRRDLRRAAPAPGAARAAPARLVLTAVAPQDGRPGRTIPLNGELTIGRRPPANVLLRDDAVSGRHARVARQDGAWIVEDLGSTNGTFVNGRRLAGPAVLAPGDVLVTGSATWRFESDGADGADGAPAAAGASGQKGNGG